MARRIQRPHSLGAIGLLVAIAFGGSAAYAAAREQGERPNTAADDVAIRPFKIDVPDEALKDLKKRLARTRYPDELIASGWKYGMNLQYLQELVTYWQTKYDWREQERKLNRVPHFKTRIDGLDIHFIHVKSPEPNAFPVVMIHGWPGTFYEFDKVIEPLADPRRFGGNPADAFHVVVVSLPGYGFSDHTREMGFSRVRIAKIFIELMRRLGYARYGVQAGDVGYAIAAYMGLNDPQHIAGLQLNRCNGTPPDPSNRDAGLTAEEIRLRDEPRFGPDETGYSQIQGSKPQTIGYALNDSPVGQAAWIVEKYHKWCDCHGDPENRYSKDDLITTVMIYWLTRTATSSARYYYEVRRLREHPQAPLPAKVTVPTGCSAFPAELGFTPRSWAEQYFNVTRFTMFPRGGHFPSLQAPDLFTNEVRDFFRSVR
jgi:pimeloyl-ACP methyl ester carboxylesterase